MWISLHTYLTPCSHLHSMKTYSWTLLISCFIFIVHCSTSPAHLSPLAQRTPFPNCPCEATKCFCCSNSSQVSNPPSFTYLSSLSHIRTIFSSHSIAQKLRGMGMGYFSNFITMKTSSLLAWPTIMRVVLDITQQSVSIPPFSWCFFFLIFCASGYTSVNYEICFLPMDMIYSTPQEVANGNFSITLAMNDTQHFNFALPSQATEFWQPLGNFSCIYLSLSLSLCFTLILSCRGERDIQSHSPTRRCMHDLLSY